MRWRQKAPLYMLNKMRGIWVFQKLIKNVCLFRKEYSRLCGCEPNSCSYFNQAPRARLRLLSRLRIRMKVPRPLLSGAVSTLCSQTSFTLWAADLNPKGNIFYAVKWLTSSEWIKARLSFSHPNMWCFNLQFPNDMLSIFSYAYLPSCLSSLVRYLFRSFSDFLNWVVFLLLSFKGSLYIS